MSDTKGSIRVDSDRLLQFAETVLENAGVAGYHAHAIADALVDGSLRGVDTHGIVRLIPYLNRIELGGFNPTPEMEIEETGPSTITLNADDAPGPGPARRAMDLAVECAGRTGVSAVTVRNSNHFGMAAHYTNRAADEGCIGIITTHAGPRVIPTGGIDPFFGTNPIAYSIPTPREFNVTLDMSTSVAANAKIRHARERGESIPEGWAIDETGEQTTNPNAVHGLLPVGGPKGYGLGLLVDLCSGLLTGMGFGPHVPTLFDDPTAPMQIGHFVVVVDVSAFRELSAFEADFDQLIAELKKIRTADGVNEVKLPGERSAGRRNERLANGIPIEKKVASEFEQIGETYDVAFPP